MRDHLTSPIVFRYLINWWWFAELHHIQCICLFLIISICKTVFVFPGLYIVLESSRLYLMYSLCIKTIQTNSYFVFFCVGYKSTFKIGSDKSRFGCFIHEWLGARLERCYDQEWCHKIQGVWGRIIVCCCFNLTIHIIWKWCVSSTEDSLIWTLVVQTDL